MFYQAKWKLKKEKSPFLDEVWSYSSTYGFIFFLSQIKLDLARQALYQAREQYRNKFVEQPEVEQLEVEKKRTPSPKRKPSKAGKSASRIRKK